MSLNNYKFTDSDFINQGVIDLPDRPSQAGISAAQLKARFDNIPKIIIALGKINGLLDYLQTGAAGADVGLMDGGAASKLQAYVDSLRAEIGAGKIGMEGLYDNDSTGSTVKDKLLYLSDMIRGAVRFTPRGVVNNSSLLPTSGNEYGDFFYVRTADPNTYDNYVWCSDPDRWESFGQVSQYTIDEINDQIRKISNGITQSPTIAMGMNPVIRKSDGVVAIPQITFTGKGYPNLLGRDGNYEDASKWNGWQATLTLDSANKVFGSNGAKITLSATTGTMGRVGGVNYDITKYYLASAYLKNGTATSVSIQKENNGGGTWKGSSAVTDTAKFTRVGFLVQPSDMASGNTFSVAVAGASGQYAYVDGFQINEISASDYSQGLAYCLEKYPYVDSYACLENPYIEIKHDNLVRNGNGEEGIGWWLPDDAANVAIVKESGKYKVTATGASRAFYQYITVKANTNYYLSGNVSGLGYISINDGNDTVQLRSGAGTFNSGIYTMIKLYMGASAAGIGYIDSIMLIEGTTAPTSYKPCRIERCVIEGKFTSDDTVTLENGKVSGLLNWKHKTLYGKDYDWRYSTDAVGYKEIVLRSGIDLRAYSTSDWINIKYDGKVLKNLMGGSSGGDQNSLVPSGLWIEISDVDSGWAETINPNADEVKADMNGWRAVANNGTRYIGFASVVDGSIPAGALQTQTTGSSASGQPVLNVANGAIFVSGDTVGIFKAGQSAAFVGTVSSSAAAKITLTGNLSINFDNTWTVFKLDNGSTNVSLLTWCKNNVAPGYEGYQLHYKLVNPEPITDSNTRIHGDIPKLD